MTTLIERNTIRSVRLGVEIRRVHVAGIVGRELQSQRRPRDFDWNETEQRHEDRRTQLSSCQNPQSLANGNRRNIDDPIEMQAQAQSQDDPYPRAVQRWALGVSILSQNKSASARRKVKKA